MSTAETGVLEQLLALTRREELRTVIDAYALAARARLAGDPTAAMSWSAIPARCLPHDLPGDVASAWVFVVRRGRAAGCHMHPNSVQHSVSYEGSGTMWVGRPGQAREVPLVDQADAPLDRRMCIIEPKTYHDAVAGDRDWVVVSFHTVPAQGLVEVGYGAMEGTSAGFEYGEAGARATRVPEIQIDPRCARATTPFPRVPAPEEFGRIFTNHMFRMRYQPDRGWHTPEILPLENLSLHPATSVLHYGQEIFEGLKAYRLDDGGVGLFRVDAHAERMKLSAERMAMPPVAPSLFVEAVRTLVGMDKGHLPADPRASVYIRPILFGSEVGLGVHAASEYQFIVFCCIVGQYAGATSRPMRVLVMRDFVRAARGGTGAAKTGGNYAGSLLGIRQAKERGFDQVLWLDAQHLSHIEELGAMNFFAVYGQRLVTPPASSTILHGVTRDAILKLAPSLGLTAEERPLAIEEILADAQSGRLTEAFAAGTAAVVSPVGEIVDGERAAKIGHGEGGEVARRLYQALGDIRSGRAPDPHGWVLRV